MVAWSTAAAAAAPLPNWAWKAGVRQDGGQVVQGALQRVRALEHVAARAAGLTLEC